MRFISAMFFLLQVLAQNASPLDLSELREWAIRQGTVEYPGRTDDGRDCQFNIFIWENGKRIYLSLGQRLKPDGEMMYFGGFLSSSASVTGQESVAGIVEDKKVEAEFQGVGTDDQHPNEKVQSKIKLERGSEGNGIMKATGSSSHSKEFVCRFQAAVS